MNPGAVLSLIGALGAFAVLCIADPLRGRTWAVSAGLGALLIVSALAMDATAPASSARMHFTETAVPNTR